MTTNTRALLAAAVMVVAIPLSAQEPIRPEDPWAAVRELEGAWEGEAEGFGQSSRVLHRWQFILDGHFLRLETNSRSLDPSGEAEIHEDVGYMSWSKSEAVLRFRQFLTEGFVNTYRVEVGPSPHRVLNFEPEGTEGMETLRARMSLRFLDAETYEMVLELGRVGEELKPCQTMRMTRVKETPGGEEP